MAEARNALAVLSKKPITDEASLKFSVAEHVKEALTSYPPQLSFRFTRKAFKIIRVIKDNYFPFISFDLR